jgi:hypothetical protein
LVLAYDGGRTGIEIETPHQPAQSPETPNFVYRGALACVVSEGGWLEGCGVELLLLLLYSVLSIEYYVLVLGILYIYIYIYIYMWVLRARAVAAVAVAALRALLAGGGAAAGGWGPAHRRITRASSATRSYLSKAGARGGGGGVLRWAAPLGLGPAQMHWQHWRSGDTRRGGLMAGCGSWGARHVPRVTHPDTSSA